MADNSSEVQAKILALALYEIRLLLAGCLGSQTDADLAVRQAAHLAYALHNEALAVVEGREFEPASAVAHVKAVDARLGTNLVGKFLELVELNE